MRLLRDAVEIDPTFAAAWAQLGIATMLSSDGFGSYGDIPEAEAQAQGKQYLDRALAIDPDLAEAHAGLGLFWQNEAPFTMVERERSREHLEKALAENPNLIDARHWLQRVQQMQGKHGEALATLEAMVERDPLYWPAVSNLVLFYVRQNRLEAARELNDRTMRYRPEMPFRQNALILGAQGRNAEALPLVEEVWSDRTDPLVYQVYAWVHYGLHEYARAVDAEGAPDSTARALGLVYLDRVEEGLMLARQALQERGDPRPMIQVLALSDRQEELVDFFRERWSSPTAFLEQQGYFRGWGFDTMVHLAFAFRETGEDRWFREAMDVLRASHDEEWASGFDTMELNMAEAAYWTLAGEPGRAMDQIDRALEKGYGFTPRFSRLVPPLRDLEGLPRYEAQQDRALAHLNEQRMQADLPPLEANL